MKQTITTKNGITYERKTKEVNYDTMISTRISKETYSKLAKIAEERNTKIRTIIREILEDYLGE